jgi:hypothetical protein
MFRTPEAAVWEYVANSLEYVDQGVVPEVAVTIDENRGTIRVSDNARGMDIEGLDHYFTMHAENPDRKAGRPGRGKFGTGKSAAFGIGKSLRIDTVRNGIRNVVEVASADIKASDGGEIPVSWVVRGEASDRPNGTQVTISGIAKRRVAREPIIRLIERYLPYWRGVSAKVVVGTHLCEVRTPPISSSHTFTPTGELGSKLGHAPLTVHVSQVPLEESQRGVAVTAGPGALVAIETAGVDRREFGNYLFGEIEVPALESMDPDDPVTPYDASRSLQLNSTHPVAGALIGFIGSKLESVRKDLVASKQAEREAERSRQLDKVADEIANVLNEDLKTMTEKLIEIHRTTQRVTPVAAQGEESAEGQEWEASDSGERGTIDQPGEQDREPVPGPDPQPLPEFERPSVRGRPDEAGSEPVSPIPSPQGGRGGLSLDFEHQGPENDRSRFDKTSSRIIINLDHPQVAAALGKGAVETDVTFQRLAWELALTEYAMVLGAGAAERDPDLEPDEVLFEVREALRRLSVKMAPLYAA